MARRRTGLEQRLDQAREVAAEPRPVRIDLSRFDDEPIEAQRMFVNWAFTKITVSPAAAGTARFDTGRITLTPDRPPARNEQHDQLQHDVNDRRNGADPKGGGAPRRSDDWRIRPS